MQESLFCNSHCQCSSVPESEASRALLVSESYVVGCYRLARVATAAARGGPGGGRLQLEVRPEARSDGALGGDNLKDSHWHGCCRSRWVSLAPPIGLGGWALPERRLRESLSERTGRPDCMSVTVASVSCRRVRAGRCPVASDGLGFITQ